MSHTLILVKSMAQQSFRSRLTAALLRSEDHALLCSIWTKLIDTIAEQRCRKVHKEEVRWTVKVVEKRVDVAFSSECSDAEDSAVRQWLTPHSGLGVHLWLAPLPFGQVTTPQMYVAQHHSESIITKAVTCKEPYV